MGIFGSIGRALFGGKKKTTSAKTSGTTDFDPYAPTIPYLNSYLSNTANLYGGGAPMFSPMEQSGYDALRTTATTPGTVDPAVAENNLTLSGHYLTPDTNPYLADIATRVGGLAGAQANQTFGSSGRTGGGLHSLYFGQGVGDAIANLYGNAYESERGRMQGAVGVAPSLEAARYLAPQSLISAGQNISGRPFELNQQYGTILSQIAGLGQQGATTGTTQNYKQSSGLIGKIANTFANKLFGG